MSELQPTDRPVYSKPRQGVERLRGCRKAGPIAATFESGLALSNLSLYSI